MGCFSSGRESHMTLNIVSTRNSDARANRGPLIVIPCLNEEAHIVGLLDQLSSAQARVGGQIVVVDGGSTDDTVARVWEAARTNPAITLLHNPQKIQSAAVNLAVACYGDTADNLIRIDAHSAYPDDFIDQLLAEADAQDAASIVVSMHAQGTPLLQRVNAAAQNSPVGNGGSKHRIDPKGEYVDHGHHALIKIAAFKEVGGYDESFTHNEDAEFDHRLRDAGHKIWLTARTVVTYFPRGSLSALGRQYYNYGRGRAQNLLKHRIVPKLRQAKVILVMPAILMSILAIYHWIFAVPAVMWAGYCLAMGLRISRHEKHPALMLTTLSAMLMHASWSLGFWSKMMTDGRKIEIGKTA